MMLIKYILKGIAAGLDEWALSLTQEQFNKRMKWAAVIVGVIIFLAFAKLAFIIEH